MAVRDVLWACPFCRTVDSIRPSGGSEECSACGATFEPGPRASIVAAGSDGESQTRTVEDWETDLPDLDEAAAALPPPSRATLRRATPPRAVYGDGGLLGWAESFGPKTQVTVELGATDLSIRPDEGPEERWPLDSIVAVQPSSSSVQLRWRGGELISLAFPESSVRLWEIRFQAAVRVCYRIAGKGDIFQFHPMIRAR